MLTVKNLHFVSSSTGLTNHQTLKEMLRSRNESELPEIVKVYGGLEVGENQFGSWTKFFVSGLCHGRLRLQIQSL